MTKFKLDTTNKALHLINIFREPNFKTEQLEQQ